MPVGLARITQLQQPHYFRKRVVFNEPGITTGVLVGTLPAGAMITNITVRGNVALAGATAINVGTTAGGTQIFTDAGGTGVRKPTIPNLSFATDTDMFVQLSGGVPSAGQVDFVVEYAPNNDQ